MSSGRREVGKRGEKIAERHLEALGFSILESNYRTPHGEIDLIAERDDLLAFVEVRTRRAGGYGTPEESLTPRKLSHMSESALAYLQRNRIVDREWRIDLVAVELDSRGSPFRIEVTENAVDS